MKTNKAPKKAAPKKKVTSKKEAPEETSFNPFFPHDPPNLALRMAWRDIPKAQQETINEAWEDTPSTEWLVDTAIKLRPDNMEAGIVEAYTACFMADKKRRIWATVRANENTPLDYVACCKRIMDEPRADRAVVKFKKLYEILREGLDGASAPNPTTGFTPFLFGFYSAAARTNRTNPQLISKAVKK